jgi:chorismate mutase
VSDDPLDTLRGRVVEIDRRIVAAVNERIELVTAIWALKDERGLAHHDEARELRLRALLADANTGPLSAEGLDQLVGAILALTKREITGGEAES